MSNMTNTERLSGVIVAAVKATVIAPLLSRLAVAEARAIDAERRLVAVEQRLNALDQQRTSGEVLSDDVVASMLAEFGSDAR